MTDHQFDDLTRRFAKSASRRTLLKGLAATVLGGALARVGAGGEADAFRGRRGCSRVGQSCATIGCCATQSLVCDPETVVCCVPDSETCIEDADCCGGSCLDGVCSVGFTPTPSCAGQGCEGEDCGPDCFCTQTTEGVGFCLKEEFATCDLPTCASSDDCPGGVCLITAGDCCDFNVCVPYAAECSAPETGQCVATEGCEGNLCGSIGDAPCLCIPTVAGPDFCAAVFYLDCENPVCETDADCEGGVCLNVEGCCDTNFCVPAEASCSAPVGDAQCEADGCGGAPCSFIDGCLCIPTVAGGGFCVAEEALSCSNPGCDTDDDCEGGVCLDTADCCEGKMICVPAEAACPTEVERQSIATRGLAPADSSPWAARFYAQKNGSRWR